MAGELHKVTVRFDADTAAFNSALQSSGKRVKTFSDEAVASVNKQSSAEKDLAHHHQRIIELEKEWQAAQAKRVRNADLRKNSEVINQFQKLNTVTATTTRTTLSSASAMRSLSSNMTTVVASMLPVNAGLLRVGSTMGTFALSGGMMVGVMAGLAALSLAWNRVTASVREAKEETQEAIRYTDQLMESLRNTELAKLNRSLVEEEELFEKATAALTEFDATVKKGGDRLRQTLVANLAETEIRLEALRKKIRAVVDEKIDANLKAWEAAQKALNKTLADAQAVVERRVAALTTLVAASRATAAETAELREAQARFRETLRDGTADVHARVEAMSELSRIQKAFTAAFLNENGRMPAGRISSLRITGAGTVKAKNLPTASEEWKLLEEQVRRSNPVLQQAANDVAGAFGNAAHDIIMNASSIADAVKNMVRSILSDLAQLVIQRQIVGPIFNALMGSATFGGAVETATGVTPNPIAAPSIGKLMSGTSNIVHQTVNLNVSAMDGRSVAQVLKEQKGTIAEVVSQAARGSGAFRAALKGA